jgi:hypothetical protein
MGSGTPHADLLEEAHAALAAGAWQEARGPFEGPRAGANPPRRATDAIVGRKFSLRPTAQKEPARRSRAARPKRG